MINNTNLKPSYKKKLIDKLNKAGDIFYNSQITRNLIDSLNKLGVRFDNAKKITGIEKLINHLDKVGTKFNSFMN